ncbi:MULTISPECIES: crotonase/enoyl-CoA hydratase family protein [unclassified Dietzia]|uniref:crotonase/enoyl-CoA hydratase family protein n=1 Tax=unclassified Dietzia TaxID=2617939 RepID=UPI0015FA11ED|nr:MULTISPECIES: crotonase/enoyl-CoA hydratase family protein [unclassified Dietzia]MBB1023998.1 crotonase/enoyl-CoA hydratase family protein [Dietzia sp. DQ12-76]MBB1027737.1 crotonase/enoyl-CoA hydratase family protein [Dietzia sp. DQ11-38-2]
MTSTEPLLVEREGHVETWTLNLPDSRNPISDPSVVEALCARVAGVNADHDVRAVVLTGAGKAFSAGGNVKDMVDRGGMFGGSPYELRDGYRGGIQRIPRALYHCEVPVVAAVNGPAVGAGCDLAMMCDLRVASTRSFFAESFVQLGIIPGDGGAWLLTKAIGPMRAAEMALTGDRVSAEKALEWGMVNEVAEPDQLLEAARALAARVAKNPPHSIRMAKKLLRESQHQSLESLLELSAAMQSIAHHTRDHREALSAFIEKRAGDYAGQ